LFVGKFGRGKKFPCGKNEVRPEPAIGMNAQCFVEFASVGMAPKAAMAFLAIHVGFDTAAIANFDVGNAFAHFSDFDT
jgi:hypothetical protein